jgi:tetratricopeptide (TPR) repeat protein
MKYLEILSGAVVLCAVAVPSPCFSITDLEPQLVHPSEMREDAQSIAEAELGAMLIRAKYHASAGDAKKAEEIYRDVIAKFPQCAYAYFQLAGLLMGADETDTRIQYLEKAIELDPGMKQAYESLVLAYGLKGDNDRVIAIYKKGIESVEDNLSLYANLADVYVRLEKNGDAEGLLLESCNRYPASPEAWSKLIEFYAETRQAEKEGETLEKALKATSNSPRLLRDVRGLYLRRKDNEKALAVLVKTLELYPESPQMWVQLVRYYLARNEKEKAKEATQKAVEHVRYDEEFFASIAVSYMNALDWDSAISVLREATKYHSGSVEIWRMLAGLYEQKGDRERARECYREILSMEPTRLQERRLLASSYVAEKDYGRAIEEFVKAIHLFPNDMRLKVDAANAYLAAGRFEEGEKIYLDLIKQRPDNSDLYLLLANYYYKGDKPEKMNETVEKAVKVEKEPARQARIYSLMGQAALEKMDIPTAVKFFQEAQRRDPENPVHAYALARAYLLGGDRQSAVEPLEKATKLARTPNPDWLLTLGQTYRALGQKDKAAESYSGAIAILRQACEKDPKNWVARYQLGQAYETVENDQLASEAYAETVKLQPENGDLRYKVATVYSGIHEHEKAREQLEKAIKLPSVKPEWFLLLGEVCRTLTKREEAAQAFDKGIALVREELDKNPQDFQVLAVLGEAQTRAKQYAEAVSSFRKAVELAGEKTDFRLRVALARALEGAGEVGPAREQYLKAAALLEKAAEQSPNDSETYFRLGLVYQNAADFPKSSEALSKAVELAGGSASYNSIMALGQSFEKLSKADAARIHYEKAYSVLSERIKEQPKDAFAHYMLANVCDKLEKLDECEKEYRTVMELDPFFASAYNNLGYTWIERNLKLDEAIKLVQKALELEPDSGAYIDSLGWAYFRQAKFDEALAELQRSLKFENTDPTIYDHLGDVYKAKNMIKEALEHWKKALEMNPHDEKIRKKVEENQKLLPSAEKESRPGGAG